MGCCVWLAGEVGRAENWPAWRGLQQNGVSREASLPSNWSPQTGVSWKISLPGNGTSCPIVWDDQVIVTATSGRDHRELHVLSFHLSDGKARWQRTISGHATPLFTQFPPLRGHAMPSPATDGKHVIALFTTGELAAFDLNGEPLWFRSLQESDGEIDNDYGLAASPVIVDDLVVVQVDHSRESYLLAVDIDSGRTEWKQPRTAIRENWTTPVIVSQANSKILLCAGSHQLAAFDARTGRSGWVSGGLARLCCPMPIPVGDRVVLTSGPGGSVQCLQLSGDLMTPPSQQWQSIKGAGFVPSAICVNGLYYYANDRGILSCHDLTSGEELWTQRLIGAFRGSPVASGNGIYFTSIDGETTVIKPARTFERIGSGTLGVPVSASPAISQGRILFRTEKHLVCIGEALSR